MPLVKANLAAALQQIFENPGLTFDAVGLQWGNAVSAYAAAIVPPSTTVAAAASALGTQLAAAFAAPSSVAAVEAAFTTFGAALGGGMAGFVPVPPAGLVGFAAQALATPQTAVEAADQLATRIHAWLTTGTSTPLPSGSPIPWS